MGSIRENAIPGVRCGSCLGRIDEDADKTKRKLHARLRPDEPYVPPSLCSVCWWEAMMALCAEEPEDGEP